MRVHKSNLHCRKDGHSCAGSERYGDMAWRFTPDAESCQFLAKGMAFGRKQRLQGLNGETDYVDYVDSNCRLESHMRYPLFLGYRQSYSVNKCYCCCKTLPFPDQLLLPLFDCVLLPPKTPVDFKYRMTMTTPATAQKKRSQNVQQMKARRERFAFSRSSQDSLLMR